MWYIWYPLLCLLYPHLYLSTESPEWTSPISIVFKQGSFLVHEDSCFQPLFVASLMPFLLEEDLQSVKSTCRAWRVWVTNRWESKVPRVMTVDEVYSVIEHLRQLHLPWSNATESYTRNILSTHPGVPVRNGFHET